MGSRLPAACRCSEGPVVPQVSDPAVIRALLETDRTWSAYPLGDLRPDHFRHCRWLRSLGDRPALLMLYRGFTPPVLFALGPSVAVEPLLEELAEPAFFLHVRPEVAALVRQRYRVAG